MYFLTEILGLVEALHANNILHADIKADNFLLQVSLPYFIVKLNPDAGQFRGFGRFIPDSTYKGRIKSRSRIYSNQGKIS